jgi:hypothetical protein
MDAVEERKKYNFKISHDVETIFFSIYERVSLSLSVCTCVCQFPFPTSFLPPSDLLQFFISVLCSIFFVISCTAFRFCSHTHMATLNHLLIYSINLQASSASGFTKAKESTVCKTRKVSVASVVLNNNNNKMRIIMHE